MDKEVSFINFCHLRGYSICGVKAKNVKGLYSVCTESTECSVQSTNEYGVCNVNQVS